MKPANRVIDAEFQIVTPALEAWEDPPTVGPNYKPPHAERTPIESLRFLIFGGQFLFIGALVVGSVVLWLIGLAKS